VGGHISKNRIFGLVALVYSCGIRRHAFFFRGGGQFAHPRKFLGGGWVCMGAQTEKIKEGVLGAQIGCARGF
jgi:hypothetical protein